MKFILSAIIMFLSATGFTQTIKKETFKVEGNCGMCKKNIEKAAILQPGVSKA